MHLYHIQQCTIQNRNVHISVLNCALWDMEQRHIVSGICEIGLLSCSDLTGHKANNSFGNMSYSQHKWCFSRLDNLLAHMKYWVYMEELWWLHIGRQIWPAVVWWIKVLRAFKKCLRSKSSWNFNFVWKSCLFMHGQDILYVISKVPFEIPYKYLIHTLKDGYLHQRWKFESLNKFNRVLRFWNGSMMGVFYPQPLLYA